jgi:AcrR family transcriptional regulator
LISARSATAERLFDIAAELFCERGYAVTTTREIAAAVGIQQASLYYHIPSKEDLLFRICVSSLEHLHAKVASAVRKTSDPLDRIHALARTHLRTILRHQHRNVTMLNELRALSGPHRIIVVALRRKYADLVRTVLEEAQSAGAVRADIEPRYLYLALLNILNWAVLWFRRGQNLSADPLARMFTSIYLHGAAAPGSSLAPAPVPALPAHTNLPETASAIPARLLETAAILFSRKGYAAATTREIAEMLGIQKPSLYYHIDNKEDLLYAICKSSLEQIAADVSAALAHAEDPLGRTRALVHAHVDNLIRDQARHAAAVSEMRALSGSRLSDIIVLRDAYEKLVRDVLRDAQRAGVLRDDIPDKFLSLGLLGLLNRIEIWYRPDGSLAPAELAQVFETIFLEGVATTSRSAAPSPDQCGRRVAPEDNTRGPSA